MNRTIFILAICFAAIVFSVVYFREFDAEEQAMTEIPSSDELLATQRKLESVVMGIDGVVGIAQSKAGQSLVFLVLVEDTQIVAMDLIPKQIDGIAVVIEKVGSVNAQ